MCYHVASWSPPAESAFSKMIRSFKCMTDEYNMSSISSEGASRSSSPNLKVTKLTLCRSSATELHVAWSVNDTLFISRADAIGKVSR